ncbi:recombination protein NinG [Roseateles sp. PN1]|uniref:recombination protein NinG n=1 Tax=Roseateles sp. PN1 TaxID=3137372 RepID=UPI00313A1956
MKPKRCKFKGCGVLFTPRSPMQCACSPLCAMEIVRAKKEQADTKARQAARKADRQKREVMKTIPQLKKEAQIEFNRFIRARDRAAGFSCVCCDRPLEWQRIGGAVDAGHYRSTGSADHLRFDEDNCHAQRSDCNRYGAGRAVDYRIGLIRRIGAERVEALENRNQTAKWERDFLRDIKATYRAKARELEKQQ